MTSPAAPLIKERQRELLDAIKHRGKATVPELALDLDLNVETVRDHMRTMEAHGIVRRDGTVPPLAGRGRPEIVFVLTREAQSLFPGREGEILRALTRYLISRRHGALLRGFFREYMAERRQGGRDRVSGLKGDERTREVISILEEMGFMPVLDDDGATLRLSHCPMRGMVDATDLPCREEVALLTELLGMPLKRVAHIRNGDMACSYQLESK